MGKKAMILGSLGQAFNNKIVQKIEKIIRIAVEEYDVTDFYFGNEMVEYLENPIYNALLEEYVLANETLLKKYRYINEKIQRIGYGAQ